MVELTDVRQAQARLKPHVLRTPLQPSPALSHRCGGQVWLKLECYQHTGSFKLRGALNALMGLSPEDRQRGVVTASAGNHGLGLARAAELTETPATIVVPETASQAKVGALRRFGCELILHGINFDEAEGFALDLARDRHRPFVSSYNHPGVIAGGGTIGLEILEDLPAAEILVVPTGGGGLISGIALAAKGLKPHARVYGIQSAASPNLYAALRAGRIVPVEIHASLADGLLGNLEPDSLSFDLARRYVDGVELVEEADIARAVRSLLEVERVLVEGSGAVGLAALELGLLEVEGRVVVLVLTGRNIALETLRAILDQG